jgi:hypothetical protein
LRIIKTWKFRKERDAVAGKRTTGPEPACINQEWGLGSDMILVIREESAGGGYSNSYHPIRSSKWWEDRYHSAAIEADEHLHRCLIYIDLNMVRAIEY